MVTASFLKGRNVRDFFLERGWMATIESYEQMIERTTATLEKYREGADELKEVLGKARAGRKVQILAMIDRLEHKYDGNKLKLEELADFDEEAPSAELGVFHQKIVSELSDMRRTIERRIR